jgi:CRP-like cAMP-binding protein
LHKGDQGEEFFIIEKGKVDCIDIINGEEIVIRTLTNGNHFGELALIKNEARSLSVKVNSEDGCSLLSLDR